MMTLKDVARIFNTVEFTDTYGTASFVGQVLPYPDSTRSGAATRRRILEVSPTVSIPEKRTITESSSGQIYILSTPAYDYYNGEVIRVKYPMMPVEDAYSLGSLNNILSGVGATANVYCQPSYVRRVIAEDQADYLSSYEIYMSSYFSASEGQVVYSGGNYYRFRQDTREDDIGFTVGESIKLRDPLGTATFQAAGTTYNPVADNLTPPAPITGVVTFSEHIILDYVHEALGFIPIAEGDKAISFLKSQVSSVKANDKIGTYKILSVDDRGTYWTIHGRRV